MSGMKPPKSPFKKTVANIFGFLFLSFFFLLLLSRYATPLAEFIFEVATACACTGNIRSAQRHALSICTLDMHSRHALSTLYDPAFHFCGVLVHSFLGAENAPSDLVRVAIWDVVFCPPNF